VVVALLTASRSAQGVIMDRSRTPLNSPKHLAAVFQFQAVRRMTRTPPDLQNVRRAQLRGSRSDARVRESTEPTLGGSSAALAAREIPPEAADPRPSACRPSS
jgi:hypothetical protein